MIKKTLKDFFGIKPINLSLENHDIIFTLLQKHIKSDSKIMICVSWWADSIFLSVLLLSFFKKNKLSDQNIYFLHLNHSTRKNNIKDQKFIEDFFKWYNLSIKKRKNDTKPTENNLRKWRYEEIKKESDKKQIDFILFGHNLTDRIESSFMNILRWCSLQWFKSMQFHEKHHILKKSVLRPLINLSKEEITDICKKNKIPYIRDESNSDPKTSLRNFLRLNIFPQLYILSNKQTKTSNSFIQSFQKIYENLDQEIILQNQFEDIIKSPYRNCKFWYKLNTFKSLLTNETLVQILQSLWIYQNINQKNINEVTSFLKNKDQWFKYFNWTYFFVSHSQIYIIQAPKNFRTKTIDKKITITNLWKHKLWKIELDIQENKDIWQTLRFPKKWDKFRNKTRNQYCVNQKIPIFRRSFIPVLEKNWKIIKTFKDIYII